MERKGKQRSNGKLTKVAVENGFDKRPVSPLQQGNDRKIVGKPTNRWRGRRRQHWLVLELLVAEVALTAAVECLWTKVLLHTRLLVVAGLVVQPTTPLLNLHLYTGHVFISI